MKRIASIKFGASGQMEHFSSDDPFFNVGDRVLIDSGQGVYMGRVMCFHERLPEEVNPDTLPVVIRPASPEDLAADTENQEMLFRAKRFCEQRIRERTLDMKLVAVETLFDRSKLIFFFTAPTRIDFRELVKDLVREYHTRIELRQIGVRHETQMVGALGSCGMTCCCRRFLRKFMPVTIKMAKEQNLFLNPTKISGICGRLLCCLSYEQENYDIFHRTCPRLGKRYQTTKGAMKVLRANLFRNSVAVLSEQGEELEFTLDEWKEMEPRRPEPTPQSGVSHSSEQTSQMTAPSQDAENFGHAPQTRTTMALMVIEGDVDTLEYTEDTGENMRESTEETAHDENRQCGDEPIPDTPPPSEADTAIDAVSSPSAEPERIPRKHKRKRKK